MGHNTDIALQSGKQDWMTPGRGKGRPNDFLERVERLGRIMFDPCGHPRSYVRPYSAVYHPSLKGIEGFEDYAPELVQYGDGLQVDWRAAWLQAVRSNGHRIGPAFVNWPYGATENPQWAKKVVEAAGAGVEIVVLCAARVGTVWWCRNVNEQDTAAIEVEGRIKFIDATNPDRKTIGATFDASVVYYGNRKDLFLEAFGDLGRVRYGKPK